MADQEQGTGNVRQEFNLGRAGLNMDSSVNQVEKGKLTYALNASVENFNATAINYQNEPGNELCLNFPEDFHLIGTHFIQEKNKHIFFLTNPQTGASQIGYMDNNDCVYHTYVQGACLNFDVNYPIQKAVHKISNCTTEIFWTDGLNPRRFLDLENIPYVTFYVDDNICEPETIPVLDCNKINVQPNFTIPNLSVNSIVNGGDLVAGIYQFAIQYCSAQGNAYTSFYSVTNPTPIANPQLTTVNFNYAVGKSIVLDISNIDLTGYFQYYNLAVIKTVNDIASVQLVGTYFIDGATKQITYTGQNVTAIALTTADIFEKYPYYDIAQDVTAVQDILVWDQLTSINRVNYQKIANKIDLQWQTYKIPAGENYADEINATNLRGYLRDEIYPFEIVFLLDNGKQTDGFHIPGRAPVASDLTPVDKATNNDFIGSGTTAPYWKIYNTGSVVDAAIGPNIGNATPYQYGDFAYWESEETYPCNTLIWGDLAGQPIRHHKFPDVLVSPIFDTPSLDFNNITMQTANAVYPIGVKINTQQILYLIANSDLTTEQKASIVAYKIVRGDRSTNRSIVAKGIIRNVGKYTREGTDYYYPNYPYNDIKVDPFLLKENNAYNSQCQTFNVVVTTAGTVQYTDCGTGEVLAIDMPLSMIKLCSVSVPLVISGAATFKNVTANSYTLTAYEGITTFSYINPVTSISSTISVLPNSPYTVSSTTVPTYISGSKKYTILQTTDNKNTNCYPSNLNGFDDNSKYRMVFNSPETSFGQPTLGSVLKLESAIFGGGRAHFVQVKKHALYKLVSKQAQVDALNSSYNIAKLTGTLDATAMFTAYQAYLTIYINGISRKNFAYSFNSVAQYDYSADIENAAADASGSIGVKQRELDLYQYLIPGVQSVGDFHNVNNYQRESSVYLKTPDLVIPLPFAEQTPSLVVAGNSLITDDSRFTISQKGNCGAPEMQEDIKVVSYYSSIKTINVNQWGQMYSYNTIDTGFQKRLVDISGVETIFGGDTFIGKFAFKTKLPFFIDNRVGAPDDSDIFYDEIGNVAYPQYWYSARSVLSDYLAGTTVMKNIISVKAHFFDCPNDYTVLQNTTTTTSTTPAPGTTTLSSSTYSYDGKMYLFAYGIPYYYVESSINVDLRQAFNNLEGDFYPHVSTGIPDNWLQQSVVPIQFDNTYTYNVTYSRQNTENYFSHLPVDWTPDLCNTTYPFRAIYSEAQADNPNVKVNSWLNYAPTSYFDFPQNYGKLTSLDGIQNKAILARFENKSLLYNSLLTMNTSNPQAAYLGNPSLFKGAPPVDFAETDLGYVGSQNKFLLKIPNGQVTVDAKRGQIFMISGIAGQIQDMSAFGSGLNKFFTDHLAFEILRYFPTADTDNHFNSCGLHGVYDSKYDRIIISKLDYIPQLEYVGVIQYDDITGEYYINKSYDQLTLRQVISLTDRQYFCNKSWTLSFSINTNCWVSFHSYIPNWYIGENNFFYSGLNEGCDLHAIAVMEIPSPTTTSTTTATPINCNLDGSAIYVDADAHWENVGDPYCDEGNCVTYQEQIDTNPSSPTFNDTRNIEVLPNICNTEANYVADGDAYCVECNAYQNYIDDNLCSSTYGNIETNLLGSGAPCDYEPAWINTGDPYCEVTDPVTRTCTSFQLQTNTNPCYTNVQQTRIIVSPVDVCNTSPIWVQLDEAQNYVCVYNATTGVYDEYYKEEDQNPCSNSYTQTRTGGLVPGGEGNAKCNAFPNIWYRLEECYTGDLFWSSAFTNGGANNPVIGQLVFGYVPPNFNNPAAPIPGRNTQFIIINSLLTDPSASPSIGIASAGGTECLATTTTTTTKHTFAFARNTQTSPSVDLCNLGFPSVGPTNPPSSTPAYLSGAAQVEPLTPFVTNYLVVAGTGVPVNGGNNKWYIASGFNLKYHYSVRVDTDGFLHEWTQCSGAAYQAYTVILVGQSDAATACAYPIETSSQTLYADYDQVDGSIVPRFYTDELCSLKFEGNDFWYAWQLGAGTKYSGQISDLGATSNITAC